MKELPNIPLVSDGQVAFGVKLGLDLRGCTVEVAAARIEDAIDLGFRGVELSSPTPKQVELAAKFGYDVSTLSRRVGEAVIRNLLEQMNHDTIASEGLAPGVVVVNIHDPIPIHYTISSIHPNGTVYYRGGQGKKAWARSLRRVGAAELGCSARENETIGEGPWPSQT